MESQLDKTYYEGIFGSGAITPEVLAEMDAQASRLVDELAQANAEISALKRTAMRASVAIVERDATIERLRNWQRRALVELESYRDFSPTQERWRELNGLILDAQVSKK